MFFDETAPPTSCLEVSSSQRAWTEVFRPTGCWLNGHPAPSQLSTLAPTLGLVCCLIEK